MHNSGSPHTLSQVPGQRSSGWFYDLSLLHWAERHPEGGTEWTHYPHGLWSAAWSGRSLVNERQIKTVCQRVWRQMRAKTCHLQDNLAKKRKKNTEIYLPICANRYLGTLIANTNLWHLYQVFWHQQLTFPKSGCFLQSLQSKHLQLDWKQSTGWTWASCISERKWRLFKKS